MTELPLFPLHAVLCPGIALPLHVFEPRYRAMVARCLADASPFVVVRIREGREVGMSRPDLERIGTIAEIRESERHGDGRYDLVVIGGARIRLDHIGETPDGYLLGDVAVLDEPLGNARRARMLAAAATQRFIEYLELVRPVEGEPGLDVEVEVEVETEGEGDLDVETAGPIVGPTTPPEPPAVAPSQPGEQERDARLDEVARRLAVPEDPTALSHLLSGIVQVEAIRRQALLEAPTTEARLERLDALLRQEISLLERRLATYVADPRATRLRRN